MVKMKAFEPGTESGTEPLQHWALETTEQRPAGSSGSSGSWAAAARTPSRETVSLWFRYAHACPRCVSGREFVGFSLLKRVQEGREQVFPGVGWPWDLESSWGTREASTQDTLDSITFGPNQVPGGHHRGHPEQREGWRAAVSRPDWGGGYGQPTAGAPVVGTKQLTAGSFS